ncbi:MAG TPA: hypothetical protein VG965_00365 [Patescibacteria group bacterium]|nr:hypothetical protein [Patescibacteria group bacterium]
MLLIIALIDLMGLCLIKQFNLMPNSTILGRISFAYGAGIGLVYFQMFIYAILKISYDPLVIVVPWLIFIIFVILKPNKKINLNRLSHLDRVSSILLIGILLTVCFVLFEALIRPLSAWDAWVTWFLAAKDYFLIHAIDPYLNSYTFFSVQPVPILVLTFVFTLLGQVNDQVSLLIYTSFYISLLLMLYSSLRKIASVKFSLLFVFLFATLGDVIRHAGRYDVGYIDLPLGYFFFACFLLLKQLNERFSSKTLILLNFLLAVTALVKSDGLPYFLISQLIILYILKREKKLKLVFYTGLSFLLVVSWPLFLTFNHIPQFTFNLFSDHLSIKSIPIIVERIFVEALNIQRWNLLWPTFIVCIIVAKYTKTLKMIAFILASQFIFYCFDYIATTMDVGDHINGSLDRVLLQITPLATYFISITIIQLIKDKLFTKKYSMIFRKLNLNEKGNS